MPLKAFYGYGSHVVASHSWVEGLIYDFRSIAGDGNRSCGRLKPV
jgi:hypothetical protein